MRILQLSDYQLANVKCLFDVLEVMQNSGWQVGTGDWFWEVHQKLQAMCADPTFSHAPNVTAEDQLERMKRLHTLVRFNQGIVDDEVDKVKVAKNKEINHLLDALMNRQKVIDRQKEEKQMLLAAIAEGRDNVYLRDLIEKLKNKENGKDQESGQDHQGSGKA